MTSKVAPYLAAAAIALALPLSALAQQGGKSMPGATPAPAPAPAPMQSQSPSGGADAGKSAIKQPLEATDLKGKDVYDAAGKKVGSIDDVVPPSGQARDVVLSVGGILGIGSKKILVPASDIERGNEGRLVIAMTEEQLEKLPEYEMPKRERAPGPATSPSTAPGSAPKRP